MKSKRAQELSSVQNWLPFFFCSCYSVAIPCDVSFWLTLGHCTNPFDCATKLIIDLLPIVCLVGTSFKVFFLKSFSLFSSTIFSCRNTRLFGIASIFISESSNSCIFVFVFVVVVVVAPPSAILREGSWSNTRSEDSRDELWLSSKTSKVCLEWRHPSQKLGKYFSTLCGSGGNVPCRNKKMIKKSV